jgi:hypothetical protein
MAKTPNDIDLFNDPILKARGMGVENNTFFLQLMPNRAGQVKVKEQAPAPTLAELKRIFGRQ